MRSAPLSALLAAALPLSCAAYEPGALRYAHDTYDVRTIGCLDIAVRALRDPVIAFTVGNRCEYPVGVDFRALRVRAFAGDGSVYHPTPGDPRGELHEAVIDAHAIADVALDFPVPVSTPSFCVDVAALNVDTPAPRSEEMCFEKADGWISVAEPRRRPRAIPPPLPRAPTDPPDLEAWPETWP
jgi:hypothetical protein